MHDALRLYHHLNAIRIHAEQPSRLHDLQTLVHKACGVNGNLRSHIPVRIVQRLRNVLAHKICALLSAEGSAGAGKKNLVNPLMRLPVQTLENRAVLRIHRKELHSHGFHRRHDKMPRRHQRLLVGKRNRLPGTDRSNRRLNADHSDHCIQKQITVLHHRDLA